MPQIDAESDPRRHHRRRVGFDRNATDGELDLGIDGADLVVERCRHPRESGNRIASLLLRQRASMAFSACDHDLKRLLALDTGDNADDAVRRLEQWPLLDVQFE